MKLAKLPRLVGLTLATAGAACSAGASPGPAPTTLRALYGLKPPSALKKAKTALVLVDFQGEFRGGRLPLADVQPAVAHAADLAAWARRSGVLVVDVQNIITRPGSPLFSPNSASSAFMSELAPQAADFVVVKSTGGAFSKTNLDAELHARGIDTLIVAGLMTHLAVQITVSDGAVLGYHVIVAGDATATRALPSAYDGSVVDALALQRAALATMADRAADVLPSRRIIQLPLEMP